MNTPNGNRRFAYTDGTAESGSAVTKRNNAAPASKLAVNQAAEIQDVQERQMELQAKLYELAEGLHTLRVGAATAKGLSPVLSQLVPQLRAASASHQQIIGAGLADGVVTTTILEFYVEDIE